ncbi:DUF2179 domain-containing protein [Gudongella sp. DL1XJH-153]|uniref:DUF2179 domain-containing protein n=1 Tax=Gudongella sp. DL1XJH-153 TaxID=3409804 RepID=UPI003BB567EC
MEMIFGYFLIFFARMLDMSMATVRTLMVMQGRKFQAALLGFFEVGIYVMVLGKVVNSLDNPYNLLSYCLGFAAGNYVGIMIENKIALGNLSAQIILKTANNDILIDTLRSEKFGVTSYEGQGIEGPREMLTVALNRKDLPRLKRIVDSIDANAFITVNSISPIRGGYFIRKKK